MHTAFSSSVAQVAYLIHQIVSTQIVKMKFKYFSHLNYTLSVAH